MISKLDTIDIIEISPKTIKLKGVVNNIAEIVVDKVEFIEFSNLLGIKLMPSVFDFKILKIFGFKIIKPKVDVNDKSNPISPAAKGFAIVIIRTARPKEFKESDSLSNTREIKYRIHIIPALTTEGKNPVISIKNPMPKQDKIADNFLGNLSSRNMLNKNWPIIDTCRPDTDKICDTPMVLKSFFIFSDIPCLSLSNTPQIKDAQSSGNIILIADIMLFLIFKA